MGSGASTPARRDEKHPLGLKPERTNNAETGKVLPWFCGHARLGLTWIGPAYNQASNPVTSEDSGGKGSSEGEVTGYDYLADCAGIVCLGLVDVLTEVWMDQEKVWRGTLQRDAEHPNFGSIEIEGRGTMHIYWGTETQEAPAVLAANGHPGYRGQCYVFFEQLYFGRDKTNAPDVELVIKRAPLNYTGVALGGAKTKDADASLVHALVELLSHPRVGFGFTAADFDLPQLATSAAKLLAEGIAASPLLDEAETVDAMVEKFCEYMDAWPSFRDGVKLQLLLARSPEAGATAYPLIGEYDLVQPPRHTSEGQQDTANKVVVKFTDWQRYFERDSETAFDAGNYAKTGRWTPVTLDRTWITVRAIAQKVARRHAKLVSVPLIRDELVVRRDLVDDELGRRADDVRVGGFVRVTYAFWNLTLLMRVVKKVVPSDRSQAIKLTVESDLYQDAVLAYTADDPPGPDDDLNIDAGGALNWEIVELPAALVSDDAGKQNIAVPYFGVLASRASALDTRLAAYASQDGSAYKRVVVQQAGKWAIYGTLDAAMDLGPQADLAVTVLIHIPTGQADYRAVGAAVGDNAALWRGDFLLYCDGEWMSYREAYNSQDSLTGARMVTLHGLVRHRFGSVIKAHDVGAGCWLIRKSDLLGYTNSSFRLSSDDAENTLWFKVTTGTKTTWFPAVDVTAETMTVQGVTPQPVPPANLRFFTSTLHTGAGGDGATAAFTWDTGTMATLSVLWEDRAYRRNAFFASWLKPYRGEQSYVVTVRPLGWVEGDPEYQLPEMVYPADEWSGHPGTRAHVLTTADIITALGVLPDVFSVTVVAVERGVQSLPVVGWVVINGTAGVAPLMSGEQADAMTPSGLRRVVYAADPELTLWRNFEAVANHWSIPFGTGALSVAPLAGVSPKLAKTRTISNFFNIQAWVRANVSGQGAFTLYSLTGATEPEWVVDTNFERLNAIW
jgi:hypothetical protein